MPQYNLITLAERMPGLDHDGLDMRTYVIDTPPTEFLLTFRRRQIVLYSTPLTEEQFQKLRPIYAARPSLG